MDGPPFPCGRTFMYLQVWWFVQTFSKYKLLPNQATVGLTEDWQTTSQKTGWITAWSISKHSMETEAWTRYLPPIHVTNQSWRTSTGEVDPIVFEFDAQGGILTRLLGSIEDFRKIYRRLCDLVPSEDRTLRIDRPSETRWGSNGKICGRNLVARDGQTSMPLKNGAIMSEVILICTL
jgi:hypothetical protein